MEVGNQHHSPITLHREKKKNPATHEIGGWVSPIAGLDDLEKRKISCPCWDSVPILLGVVAIPTTLSQLEKREVCM